MAKRRKRRRKQPPPRDRRRKVLVAESARAERELLPVLLKARDRIQLAILQAARDGKLATSGATQISLYRQLGRYYAELGGDVRDWAAATTEKVAQEWYTLAKNDFPRSAHVLPWEQFSKKYAQTFIDATAPSKAPQLSAVNSAVSSMAAQDVAALRLAVRETVRVATLTGMTGAQLQRELLARVMEQRPSWKFIDASGRAWNPRSYFAMLARTIPANVARETYAAQMAEAGYDLAVIDGGPSITGDSCDEWAGRVVSMTGATKGYSTWDDASSSSHIAGPNCRHYPSVVLQGELDEAKQERAKVEEQIKKAEPLVAENVEANKKRANKRAKAKRKAEKTQRNKAERIAQQAAADNG